MKRKLGILRKIINKFNIIDFINDNHGLLLKKLHRKYDVIQIERRNKISNKSDLLTQLVTSGYCSLGLCDNLDRTKIRQIQDCLNTRQINGAKDVRIIQIEDALERFPFLANILLNSKLQNLVHDYLGEDARFDWINIWRVIPGVKVLNSSEAWHHDRVGTRLKIFIYLSENTDLNTLPTLYAKSSHNKIRNNFGRKNSRDKTPSKENTIELRGVFREMIVFDTNGSHRGTYNADAPKRDIIQLEFSSKSKSSKLPRWASCGPREVSLSSESFETILNSKLFDQKCVTQLNDDKYLYDQYI